MTSEGVTRQRLVRKELDVKYASMYSIYVPILMLPVSIQFQETRALIQYKDAILPVKEIPLWR